jgi:hypothetical protein
MKFFLQTPIKPIDPCLGGGFGCVGNVQKYNSGIGGSTINDAIIDFSAWVAYIAGAVAILFIIFGAFKMLTSVGDSKKYEEGLKSIQYAVTGLVIIALSFGGIAAVLSFLNSVKV